MIIGEVWLRKIPERFLRAGKCFLPGKDLISCRFLWVYQIFKSRNASFCSFLLSTPCGTLYFERLLKICKSGIRRFANPAGLPCASRLCLRCSRTSLCDVKSLHILRSFSEGGWVYQILALLRAISRGFFYVCMLACHGVM